MKYLLDTNICIYIIKQQPRKVLDRFNSLEIGDICISVITFSELEYGVQKSRHQEKNKVALMNFLSPLEILPFNQEAALEYGRIRAKLESSGNIIGAYDLMIGAHALAENLILITNNQNEFSRIPNLSMENWAD